MEKINDSEMTPERARKIGEILKERYEDQYQCRLVRITSKEQASA